LTKQGGALSGLKVLSFAQMAQGPSAVQYLADMGADVIKVERPIKGAWERSWSGLNLFINGESAFFLALNRNKKSITVNIKEEEGKKIIFDLIKNTDILVENFRPGVMDRLGLGYERLAEINPGLIYASASGYGSEGPYVNRPGQDLLSQAMSGLASCTGKKDDLPTPVGSPIIDVHSSSLMALGIMVALYYRGQTGQGQKVEVDLLQSAIDLQKEPIFYYLNGGGKKAIVRSKSGIAGPFYEAPYGIYETKDGYITISLIPVKIMGKVFKIDEFITKYSQEDAFDKRDTIRDLLQKKLIEKTTNEWLDLLDKEDVWCSPVNNYEQLIKDPQVKFNKTIQEVTRDDLGKLKVVSCPINLKLTKPKIETAPPKLGEHTEEVLKMIGYGKERIKELRNKNII